MSNEEIRRLFDTVLASPGPDSTDIDDAIRVAHHRRHRRRTRTAVLTGVGCAAAIVAMMVVIRTGAPTPHPISGPIGTTAVAAPSTSNPGPAGEPVISTRELIGHWQTIELDGQDVQHLRTQGGNPLTIWFRDGDQPLWGADDGCNTHEGRLTVSATGRFTASEGGGTVRGCPPEQVHARNVQVVRQANQARIVAATDKTPRRLLLLKDDALLAEFTATAPSPTAPE